MLSVTQRIKTIYQPIGGYVPKDKFTIEKYEDGMDIVSVKKEFSSIQGIAVDYLTRYMLFGDKKEAFLISIMGAKKNDEIYGGDNEFKRVIRLINTIKGLDDNSISCACKVVGYEVAFRQGVKFYKDINLIKVSNELIKNIRVLVNRCIFFLNKEKVTGGGYTFEGGYTELVSSGDCDYVTQDMLIDIKVSKLKWDSKWSLQVLMYCLLGLHSNHKELKNIDKICIFNAYENKSYIVKLSEISEQSKYEVPSKVLGYKMKYECDENFSVDECEKIYSTWMETEGSDERELIKYIHENIGNNFDVCDYQDGIYNITIDDYWTYLNSIDDKYLFRTRPLFSRTKYIKLIKKNGYVMFISVANNGSLCVLNGARLHKLNFTIEYYYKNIEKYAEAVLEKFSQYWDYLYDISNIIKEINPELEVLKNNQYREYVAYCEEYNNDYLEFKEWYKQYERYIRMSGDVHGCIIDLDYENHIYINPYDKTIIPYSATSKKEKSIYTNIYSMILIKRPEMKKSLEKVISVRKSELLEDKTIGEIFGAGLQLAVNENSDNDIYLVSNKLKLLQSIYNNKLIQIWYDGFSGDFQLKLKNDTSGETNEYEGKSKKQLNGLTATIYNYRGDDNIDVIFENNIVVTHTNLKEWENGNLVCCCKEKNMINNKYVGMTKVMNCGLKATIIYYEKWNNITVRFEDGLIRTNIRTDHFMNGKVGHIKDK